MKGFNCSISLQVDTSISERRARNFTLWESENLGTMRIKEFLLVIKNHHLLDQEESGWGG